MNRHKRYELFSKMDKNRKEYYLHEFDIKDVFLGFIMMFLVCICCAIIDIGLGVLVLLVSLFTYIGAFICWYYDQCRFLRGE